MLLDYGDTLGSFAWDDSKYRQGGQALLGALGEEPSLAGELERAFMPRLQQAIEQAPPGREIDFGEVVREALAAIDITPGAEALGRALAAQHRAWDELRLLHPDAHRLLDELRADGLAAALVSNVFDSPELVQGDLERLGLAERLDAAVFSSQVGYRKPHPAIYRAALERLGVEPAAAMFAGDRVLEDVAGPAGVGMTTCLVTCWRSDEGDHSLADHVAGELLDVVSFARDQM